MSTKLGRIASILFICTFVILGAKTAWAGLGISPSQMITPNLIKGAKVERTFILSRSDPKEDLFFTVTMEGETKDWTVLDKGTEFTMPAGEQRFPITVIATIPKDMANGEYKGLLRLVSSSKSSTNATTGTGATTALSALIQTDFTVTDEQILEYEITAFDIQDIEEESPLDVSLTLINSGNVVARPTKVHVEVYDKLNTTLVEKYDIKEMNTVKPFETGDIVIQIPNKLKIEQYWARITAYRDDKVLKEQNLVFEVVAIGSMKKQGDLKEIITDKNISAGDTMKIIGVFENTGAADYTAKFNGEIYKGGKLLKVVTSDQASVNMGSTENLSTYFTPEANGEYTIKAWVDFSGKRTSLKESKFTVGPVGLFGLSTTMLAGILVLLVAIIVLVIYLKKKGSTKKRS